ncbi:MAG: anti-sigma factor family protein [Pyrinomonadaceae bacterium]
MNCQTTQNLLDGYADGELDLLNHLQIEQHLKDCPSCARIYENLSTLKSAFADNSLYFHAPPDLRKRVQTALREANPQPATNKFWQWRLLALATSFAAIVVLSLIFFQARSSNEDLLAQEFVSGHIRSMMANHLTDVPSSDQHTVKPWFDGKLDFSPPVVDLTAQGFPLVGGRLDYIASRPVAALVYQRRQHFINLFVFPTTNNADTGNKILVRQGYNLIYWNKSGMTFWAVSDLNLNELQEFTQTTQK